MGKIIQVQLGEYRPVFSFDLNQIDCQRGDMVILDSEDGSEFGKVVSDTRLPLSETGDKLKGKVVRRATEGDTRQIENNRMKAKDALQTCMRKITDQRLDMQMINAEYTFDSSKIIFFFTSEGRVDFRNLVKDLAKIFRVRIELKQIGVRDKAKIVCGYGICGREICCASYMKDFCPLSVKMAKEQGLPLNPSRISGVCGRIKCCMSYEFEVYKDLSKSLPKLGEKIVTPEGRGKVIEVNVFKKFAMVDLGEGRLLKMTYGKKDEK
ncbi:MAG TPA: regulatory iron-sulfur-containing complex subunit RicT [Candidatus Omnitrophota bacterium]|nr:regulatory iron-sulfur-containing complex subunit RicT [Candidatus Omnitrophota bacterium]